MANTWVSLFCRQAEFVLTTDGNIFVDMYELFIFTRRFLNTTSYINNKFLFCPIISGVGPIRDPNNRWYVSYNDTKDSVYPSYCNGNVHITPPGTASKLAKMAELSKPLPMEDVYVTGYLAKRIGVKHYDFTDLHSLSDSWLLIQKMKQNTKTHTKDFLSGLINRNFELSLTLTKKAEWCYNVKCKNSIYHPPPLKNISFDNKLNILTKL